MSLQAHGTIGKALTFARRRGTAYAKSYATPKDANTLPQQAQRLLFETLVAEYHNPERTGNHISTFRTFIQRNCLHMTAFNYYLGTYLRQPQASWSFCQNLSAEIEGGESPVIATLWLEGGLPNHIYNVHLGHYGTDPIFTGTDESSAGGVVEIEINTELSYEEWYALNPWYLWWTSAPPEFLFTGIKKPSIE
jgi:hypothetical protein